MAQVKRNTPLPPPEPEREPPPIVATRPKAANAHEVLPGDTLPNYDHKVEDELYLDPTVEKLLPWGPLEWHTARGGRRMQVRRCEDVGGNEPFWAARKAHEELLRVNGVRVWARKAPDSSNELLRDDGHRIWDAVWYVPAVNAAKNPPPRRHSAPRPSGGGGNGVDLVVAVAALMKRLSTTKAIEFDEYKAVHAALRKPITPVLEEI